MVATITSIYFGAEAVLVMHYPLIICLILYLYWSILEPIQQISEQFNALQNGFASAEKIDVLDTKPDIEDAEDAIE